MERCIYEQSSSGKSRLGKKPHPVGTSGIAEPTVGSVKTAGLDIALFQHTDLDKLEYVPYCKGTAVDDTESSG